MKRRWRIEHGLHNPTIIEGTGYCWWRGQELHFIDPKTGLERTLTGHIRVYEEQYPDDPS